MSLIEVRNAEGRILKCNELAVAELREHGYKPTDEWEAQHPGQVEGSKVYAAMIAAGKPHAEAVSLAHQAAAKLGYGTVSMPEPAKVGAGPNTGSNSTNGSPNGSELSATGQPGDTGTAS